MDFMLNPPIIGLVIGFYYNSTNRELVENKLNHQISKLFKIYKNALKFKNYARATF